MSLAIEKLLPLFKIGLTCYSLMLFIFIVMIGQMTSLHQLHQQAKRQFFIRAIIKDPSPSTKKEKTYNQDTVIWPYKSIKSVSLPGSKDFSFEFYFYLCIFALPLPQ